MSDKHRKHPFTIAPIEWPGQISIGRAVLGVILTVSILIVLLSAAGNPLPDRPLTALRALYQLLVVIGSTHLVFGCAGVWRRRREPRWLILAAGFAVVASLHVPLLLNSSSPYFGGAAAQAVWGMAQESALPLVLLLSIIAAAPRDSARTAVLTAITLVAIGFATLSFLGLTGELVLLSHGVRVFNMLLCLLALVCTGLQLRSREGHGNLVMFGAASVLALIAQAVELFGSPIDSKIDAGLGYSLNFFSFAALYIGLFIQGPLRPYGQSGKSEAFFRMLVDSSPAGIALSRKGRILHANQVFLDLTGFDSLEKAQQAYLWDMNFQNRGESAADRRAYEPEDRDTPNSVVRRLASRDGRLVHARVEHVDVDMPDGRATLTYFIDFSKAVEAQDELKRIANYDGLTGLPNRALLRSKLEQALRIAGRSGDMVAVLFIDLDQFKQVNDTLGHASGDELLKMVASRLTDVCRKEDMLGRLGGDEFLVIAQHLLSRDGAGTLASKLIQALDTPFDLDSHQMYVGGSIGISMFPGDCEDASTMIRNADVAMYHAKRGGGLRFAFYEAEMNARALERLELGTELRWALDKDEFELFYQPRVDLETGRIAGAEALLRWRSPLRGLVLPGRFVPVLEESGLIVQLGRQVLTKACRAAMGWRTLGFGRIAVAVNLSAAQFRGSVVEDVEAALSASGLPHEDLEIEITESLLFRDYEQARVPLEILTSRGIRSALDDFGTGYSSLASLHNLPVHFVKIDQSFVQALQTGRNTIVAAIINVAHTMGMRVIAEGVETIEQRDILVDLGCDEMQGHVCAPAMSEAEFVDWLRSHHKPNLVAVGDEPSRSL